MTITTHFAWWPTWRNTPSYTIVWLGTYNTYSNRPGKYVSKLGMFNNEFR